MLCLLFLAESMSLCSFYLPYLLDPLQMCVIQTLSNLNNMYWVVGNVICTCITSCQLRFSNHQPKQIFFILKMLFVLQTLNEKNMLSMHFKKLMQTCPWWIWWNKYTNWDQFTKKVDLIDKYDNSSLTD